MQHVLGLVDLRGQYHQVELSRGLSGSQFNVLERSCVHCRNVAASRGPIEPSRQVGERKPSLRIRYGLVHRTLLLVAQGDQHAGQEVSICCNNRACHGTMGRSGRRKKLELDGVTGDFPLPDRDSQHTVDVVGV